MLSARAHSQRSRGQGQIPDCRRTMAGTGRDRKVVGAAAPALISTPVGVARYNSTRMACRSNARLVMPAACCDSCLQSASDLSLRTLAALTAIPGGVSPCCSRATLEANSWNHLRLPHWRHRPVAPALRQMTQLSHLDRRGIVPVNQFARAALKYAQRSGEKLWISIGSLGRPGT